MQLNEGMLEEEKIGVNRLAEDNRSLKSKIREIEKDYEKRLDFKSKEIKELEEKMIIMMSGNKELELMCSRYQTSIEKNEF